MAHGWDPYYHNLPPLPSDTEMLRRLPDSSGTLSQHTENYIGQQNISSTVTYPDPPVPTSNVHVNSSSNPDIAKPNSLYGYQEYFNDTHWHGNEEQIDKLCLQKCETSDVSELTDGLKISKTCLPACTEHFQEEKQDCERQATSIIENYTDVKSYSEYISESDPSYYVGSNVNPRLGSERPVEPDSSKWLTPIKEKKCQDLRQNIAQTNVTLLSDGKSTMNLVPSTEKNTENYFSASDFSSFASSSTITENNNLQNENEYSYQQGLKVNEEGMDAPEAYSFSPISDGESSQEKQIEQGTAFLEEVVSSSPNVFKYENLKHNWDNTASKEPQSECIQKGEHLFALKNKELECSNFQEDGNRCWNERKKEENNSTNGKDTNSGDKENTIGWKSPILNSATCQSENFEVKCVEDKFIKDSSKTSDQPYHTHQKGLKLKDAESDVAQGCSNSPIGDWENSQSKLIELDRILSKEIGAHDVNHNLPQKETDSCLIPKDKGLECSNVKEHHDRFWSEKEHEENNPAKPDEVEEKSENQTSTTSNSPILNSSTCQSKNFEVKCLEEEFSSPLSVEEANSREKNEEKLKLRSKIDYNDLDESSLPYSEHQLNKCVSKDDIATSLDDKLNTHSSSVSDCFSGSLFETNCSKKSQDDTLSSNTKCTDDDDHSEQTDNSTPDATNNSCKDTEGRDESGSIESCMLSHNPGSSSVENESLTIQDLGAATDFESLSSHKVSNTDKIFCQEQKEMDPMRESTTTPKDENVKNEQKSHVKSFLLQDDSDTVHYPHPEKENTPHTKEQTVFNKESFLPQNPSNNTSAESCLEVESTGTGENLTTYTCSDQRPLPDSPLQQLSSPSEKFAQESFHSIHIPELGTLSSESQSKQSSPTRDISETNVIPISSEEMFVDKHEEDQKITSKDQDSQIQFSVQMKKSMHPVVILKTTESSRVSNSYHCAYCHYPTDNVDFLIEHHHSCHPMNHFQFCKTCHTYQLNKEPFEKHSCGVKKQRLMSLSESTQYGRKIKNMRTQTVKTPFQCEMCGLFYASSSSVWKHKKIPGRCKRSNLRVKSSPNSNMVPGSLNRNMQPYVKLVDISKTIKPVKCGESVSDVKSAKKHCCIIHKSDTVSSTLSIKKMSNLNVHQIQKDVLGKHKCLLCPRLFKYTFTRNRHLRHCVRESIYGGKMRVNGRFHCPLCEANFATSQSRTRHIKRVCLKKSLNQLAKCKITKKQPAAEKKQNDPMPLTKNEELNTQQLLDEQENSAQQTLSSNHVVQWYKCSLCPAAFRYSSGKSRHMKKHKLFHLTGKTFRYRHTMLSSGYIKKTSSKKTEPSEGGPKSTEAASQVFNCRFCGKVFNLLKYRNAHELNHHGKRPFKCMECGKGFKNHHHLNSHKLIHQRRIQCMVCRKIVSSISDLIQHRKRHTKRGMLQCPDCPLQFQYPAHLLRHVESHIKKEKASQTKQESSKPQQFMEPMEKDNTSQLQCSICKDIFEDAQVLRKHCLTHISGSSLNQCPFCKKNFNSRPYLLRHMIRHTRKEALSCTDSEKQISCKPSPNFLSKKHLASTISSSSKCHSCTFCPRRFARKDRLKKHTGAHRRNSLHKCSNCGQFFEINTIRQHQIECNQPTKDHITLPQPKKVTSQASQVIQKMPLQAEPTNLLPLQCSYCAQTFRFKSLLMRHLVTHTGVEPYACMYCGNRYGSQTACTKHEAFCTGAKNEGLPKAQSDFETSKQPSLGDAPQGQMERKNELKCKFCTKTFSKPRSLRRHILTHNEVKPYRCKACDSCFSRYDHLKVHQTHCKGKKKCLEVRIPKVSLEDIGKGWQKKFGTVSSEKKPFKCTNCDSAFSYEKTLKRHKKLQICRRTFNKEHAAPSLGLDNSTKNGKKPLKVMKTRLLKRIRPHLTNKFHCSYCSRTFLNQWQLNSHTRLHTGENPFSCEFCGMKFPRKDYVVRHKSKCTMIPNVLCDSCGRQFPQNKLENHKKVCKMLLATTPTVGELPETTKESRIKGFSCAYCNSKFLLFSQLQEHFVSAHKMETVETSGSSAPLQHHLSSITEDEAANKRHQEGHGERANLTCNLDFAFDGEVSMHWCSRCKISFPSESELKAHQALHPKTLPFSCKNCSKGFWKKILLRNHYKKCRNIPTKGKVSQDPEAVAESDSVLVFKNVSDSSGSGVLQTNFTCKDGLTDQIPQESEGNQKSNGSQTKRITRYQCSECEKSFTDGLLLISHLEDHGRREQTRKSNVCTQCGRVCSNKVSLLKHLKKHHNAKQFSSNESPKNDHKPLELETHKTPEDTSRPYSCKLCPQQFLTRTQFYSHNRIEHADNIYACKMCIKFYTTKKSLRRHYRDSHQKEAKNTDDIKQEEQQSEESDENVKIRSEDSDSDTAPYFPCHVCAKTFTTSESLEDHQLCHLGKKPFECAECGKCFLLSSQLQQHQRMHKSEFQCQICGRGFVTFFALRKHKHTQGKHRPHRCTKCSLSFKYVSQLSEHMSTHKEDNFPCDICDSSFLSKSLRDEHRKNHANASHHTTLTLSRSDGKWHPSSVNKLSVKTLLKFHCGVCCERFADPEELSEHGCLKTNERPYSCTDCNQHFFHSSHLLKHKTSHLPLLSNTEYECNQCKVSLSSSIDFINHLKNHVEIDNNIKRESDDEDVGTLSTFLCPVCHQNFPTATEVISHFSAHFNGECVNKKQKPVDVNEGKTQTKTIKYRCSLCGLSFSANNALQHHCSHQQQETLHSTVAHSTQKQTAEDEVDVTGDDSYNCLSCSLQFSSKSELLEHQNKQHSDEKFFKCEICGRSFAKMGYLKKHQQRHGEQKTAVACSEKIMFNCTRCNSSFSALRDLTLHMRLHAEKEVGEFRCDMCYKSFSQLSHLRKHQESHVGEVVYECTECDKAFAFPHLLEEHQKSHGTSSQ